MARRTALYLRNNVLGLVAIFIALGAGAYAAGLKKNSVGPKQIKDGSVTGLEVKDDSLTGSDVNEGSLDLPAGPKGDTGATGPKGDTGASATALWASVDSSGAVLNGSHVASAALVFTGGYEVVFDRNVSACAYAATRSNVQGDTLAQPRSGNVNGVFVGTATSAGNAANSGFHLAVFC